MWKYCYVYPPVNMVLTVLTLALVRIINDNFIYYVIQ